MIAFDGDMVTKAVAAREAEQRWRSDQTQLVSGICAWYVAHPDVGVDYEDGRPGEGMRRMIDDVSRETGLGESQVLASFGAAHCLLCDTVPGFRPVLLSAWDRGAGADHP